MLAELREIVASAAGRPLRVTAVARQLGTDPAVVRAMVDHAVECGWLPAVRVIDGMVGRPGTGCAVAEVGADAAGHGCRPALPLAACRWCPLAEPAGTVPVSPGRERR